jgi:hypothetical protein
MVNLMAEFPWFRFSSLTYIDMVCQLLTASHIALPPLRPSCLICLVSVLEPFRHNCEWFQPNLLNPKHSALFAARDFRMLVRNKCRAIGMSTDCYIDLLSDQRVSD